MSAQWTADTGSARCSKCLLYWQANIGGEPRKHTCPTLKPKDQPQASLANQTLTLSDGEILYTEECGARILFTDQPELVARCLFNAAARSMGASRNEINKSARMFNDTTVAHIKTSEALRALFPTDIMTALRRPNNGAHYKDLDDRIRHFESEGWADDFELVGLADMTGRAIHIWGKRKSGRMTLRLTVIEPPFFNIGVDPSRPPIRLLCEGQNHYVALIAAALCKRPIRTVDTPRACDATQPPTPVNQQLPRGASVSSPSLILSFFLIMISISKKVLTHRLLLVAALGRAVTALKGVLLRF